MRSCLLSHHPAISIAEGAKTDEVRQGGEPFCSSRKLSVRLTEETDAVRLHRGHCSSVREAFGT